MRERELKPRAKIERSVFDRSLPMRERELKLNGRKPPSAKRPSLPMRERELKRAKSTLAALAVSRSPCGSVN